jgi:hypothetical protein
MKAKEFIPASKPRNFVAKNQKTAGAGAHKDKKKAEKQGDVKHKAKQYTEDAEPMDREFHLVKKLGRLGERIVQNPKLWDKYSEVVESDDTDWIISLIQDGTGATFDEVLKLSDLFGEIGGGLGRIIDFAWAVKEGNWERDFLNPYRKHRSQGVAEGAESSVSNLDAVFNEHDFDRLEHIWPALEDGDKEEALRQINHYLRKGKNRAWWGDLQALDIKIDSSDVENSQIMWNKSIQPDMAEGWKQNLAALGLAGLTALAPTPAAAAPSQTNTVSTVAQGTSGDQIVNHKNYKKYYDQALAGRNTARAHQTAQQIATLKVKADIAKGIKERIRDPEDWDEGNTEPGNNFAIYINGKKWKVFPGPAGAYADSPEERREYQRLKDMAQRKSQQTGKKWEVYVTGEKATESVEEGWKEKLGAAALAGSLAFGAAGAGARTLPGADPSINRLTGKPIATQQDTQQDKASDAKKDSGQQQIGFSTEYLKKVVDGKHPRPMISVDDAKQELERRGEL